MQIFCLQKAGMERHDRLRLARKRHFQNMKDAANSLGVPYGTYSGHEGGSRGFKEDELALYARRFHVSRAWLAFGDGDIDEAPTEALHAEIDHRHENETSETTHRTTATHGRAYIQVELEELRRLLIAVFQNESIAEEQAEAYADAVFVSLKEQATASLVLRLDGKVHNVVESPRRPADDRS